MNNDASLIDSLDSIAFRLHARNVANVNRWGTPCREAKLVDVANLTFDGRRIQRNWDLVEALHADPRFTVSHRSGVHFADVVVFLKG